MPAPLTLSLRQPPDSLNCILDLWPHVNKSYWLFHIQWPLHYQIMLAASITDCYHSRCCSTHLMFLFPSHITLKIHNALYSHPCQGRARHKYYIKYSICREMYSWKYTSLNPHGKGMPEVAHKWVSTLGDKKPNLQLQLRAKTN